jgi:hypothetical protein
MNMKTNVSYTAIVFDDPEDVLQHFETPEGWEKIGHHVTLNMGPAKHPELIGQTFQVTLISVAKGDNVMAAGVEMPTGVTTANATPHTTLAVDRENGGKPFLSNKLTDWVPIEPITVRGTVQEVLNKPANEPTTKNDKTKRVKELVQASETQEEFVREAADQHLIVSMAEGRRLWHGLKDRVKK